MSTSSDNPSLHSEDWLHHASLLITDSLTLPKLFLGTAPTPTCLVMPIPPISPPHSLWPTQVGVGQTIVVSTLTVSVAPDNVESHSIVQQSAAHAGGLLNYISPLLSIILPRAGLRRLGPNWEQFQSAQVPSQLVYTWQAESRLHSTAGPNWEQLVQLV